MPPFPIVDLAGVGLDFLRLDLITHLSQTTDEAENPIVEIWFVGGHREIYGADIAQPLVAWFTRQAAQFARVQAFPRPSYDVRLEGLVHAEEGAPYGE